MARRNWGVVVPPEVEPLLKVEEVARRLGCSPRTVYNRVYAGELAVIKIGTLTRFERSEVERFIAVQRGDGNGQ
jgi:excisionase family DNA binding protein